MNIVGMELEIFQYYGRYKRNLNKQMPQSFRSTNCVLLFLHSASGTSFGMRMQLPLVEVWLPQPPAGSRELPFRSFQCRARETHIFFLERFSFLFISVLLK